MDDSSVVALRQGTEGKAAATAEQQVWLPRDAEAARHQGRRADLEEVKAAQRKSSVEATAARAAQQQWQHGEDRAAAAEAPPAGATPARAQAQRHLGAAEAAAAFMMQSAQPEEWRAAEDMALMQQEERQGAEEADAVLMHRHSAARLRPKAVTASLAVEQPQRAIAASAVQSEEAAASLTTQQPRRTEEPCAPQSEATGASLAERRRRPAQESSALQSEAAASEQLRDSADDDVRSRQAVVGGAHIEQQRRDALAAAKQASRKAAEAKQASRKAAAAVCGEPHVWTAATIAQQHHQVRLRSCPVQLRCPFQLFTTDRSHVQVDQQTGMHTGSAAAAP